MADRLHILLSTEEKERYRAIAEQEGTTLSAWIRAAVKERAERYASIRRLRTAEDLERFFSEIDCLMPADAPPEPDWWEHERLIDEGRRGRAPEP